MIGMKYGQWIIIDKEEDKGNLTLWKCQCEICGKIVNSCIGDLILNSPRCGHNSGRVIPPDLVGQEFGNLTVIANPDESLYEESGNKHPDKFLYLCKCKCGNIKYVYKHILFSNVKYSKTCGKCFREDLTGRKFTRLLVVSFYGRQNQGPYWNCLCDCGNTYIASTNGLKSGSAKSCGCISRENKLIDITGQKFNRLLVLNFYKYDERKSAWWTCLCDCGNVVNVKGTNLRRGTTNSCGCFQREQTSKARMRHGLSGTAAERELNILVKGILDAKWSIKIDKALKKFQPSCVICGSTKRLCVDHVLPFSLGYRLQPGNAIRLCQVCNSSKKEKKPRDLPPDMRRKILTAALEFKRHWKSLT